MRTDHIASADRARTNPNDLTLDTEPSFSLSHFFHILDSYRHAIVVAMGAVALACLIVAIVTYLALPATRMTGLPFRLNFTAADGAYPNGARFNLADIIRGPFIAQVYNDNRLSPYIGYREFSRSIYVLESNREYEALIASYQAQLADTHLTQLDRERLQKEFEQKREGINKNDYTLYMVRPTGLKQLPKELEKKVLQDILNDWADFAIRQQHVIDLNVTTFTPSMLTPPREAESDLVMGIEILREKAWRIVDNLDAMKAMPGARLVRSAKDQRTIDELALRLNDIIRYRLEIMEDTILRSGITKDRESTIRFLENQLAYDQRDLDAKRKRVEAIRDAITMYENQFQTDSTPQQTAGAGKEGKESATATGAVPQLSDSFLDRLMTLTGRASDAEYRQRLNEDYRRAVEGTIPTQYAVDHDTAILNQARATKSTANATDVDATRRELEAIRQEMAGMILGMNELYTTLSRNMTPSTQLFTTTGPPITRTVTSVSIGRLALLSILALALALPLVVIGCLIHNRFREEEWVEQLEREQLAT